jgi:hypothetical protein
LGLSVNEQGLAVLAWVENKNTLWVSVSVPHGSGFGEPQRIASATGDIDGLKVRITFDGRAAVFWREGGAFGEAKALRLERPGGGWGLK